MRRQLKHYALPMIIAIGYRVRSSRGTQFRQWATRTLGEYLQKGFAIDDERLKKPPVGTVACNNGCIYEEKMINFYFCIIYKKSNQLGVKVCH